MTCENCRRKGELLKKALSQLFMPEHKELIEELKDEIKKPNDVLIIGELK